MNRNDNQTNKRMNLFKAATILTNHFPILGANLLDKTVLNILGSDFIAQKSFDRMIRRLNGISSYQKILLVSDLNIGDAIVLQASISALRNFLPNAHIDCMMSSAVGALIERNPEISTPLPILSGKLLAKENNLDAIHYFISSNSYDMIFNFCPQFKEKDFFPYENKLISFYPLAAMLIHNENDPSAINNIAYQTYQFVNNLFASKFVPARNRHFRGVSVFISDQAVDQAKIFLQKHNLRSGNSLVLYNPDTSSKFTRLPLSYQTLIMKSLTESRQVNHILLGGGHGQKNIEYEILSAIPYPQRKKVTIVPASLPLDVYAALIDFCDVYITGDTGPLHIAAARKISDSRNRAFRNRTAIFSIFGATPARIYGYASNRVGFFPTNQDALSRVYVSESPCRNITCINKASKTCNTVRCFEFLDIRKIRSDIVAFLNTIEKFDPKKVLKTISKVEQIAVY